MRTGIRAVVSATLVLWTVLGSNHTALAECTTLDRWPSFRDTAGSAHRIVVGHVTSAAGGGPNNRFTLRIDEVLRGSAPADMEFFRFKSGLRLTECPKDSVLRARLGDKLAIAFGALVPGRPGDINAVAFLSDPGPLLRALMPGVEYLTLDEVRGLAELPPTDATPSVGVSSWPPEAALLTLVFCALVATSLAKRLRDQRT